MERLQLGIPASGPRTPLGWANGREQLDLYDLKGVVERSLEALEVRIQLVRGTDALFHPRSASDLRQEDRRLGGLGEIHPGVALSQGLPRGSLLAELDLTDLLENSEARRWRAVPRFPAVLRDLALVVSEGTIAGQIDALLHRVGGELLESAILFDVYRGAPLAPGETSLAYSLRFRAPDRTLTEEEVAAQHAALVAAAQDQLGARLR